MARRRSSKKVGIPFSKMTKKKKEALVAVVESPEFKESVKRGMADFKAGRGTVYKDGERPGQKKKKSKRRRKS